MALVNDLSLSPQEDCEAENVWEMGGLGILTSVPITPRVVCFLCASSGHVEVRSPASWYVRQYERLFCCDETNHYILFRWFIAGTIPCLNQQFKCFCFLEISERSLLFFFFPRKYFIYLFIFLSSLFFLNFLFFKFYIIVLVLPNIEMNPPQVYKRSLLFIRVAVTECESFNSFISYTIEF